MTRSIRSWRSLLSFGRDFYSSGFYSVLPRYAALYFPCYGFVQCHSYWFSRKIVLWCFMKTEYKMTCSVVYTYTTALSYRSLRKRNSYNLLISQGYLLVLIVGKIFENCAYMFSNMYYSHIDDIRLNSVKTPY